MAGDKIGFADQIGGMDGFFPKTQMGNGHGSGFFGIVYKVSLSPVFGFLTNNLDGILIGAHRTISAQTEEHPAHDIVTFRGKMGIIFQAGMGYIFINT